jgi:hypothetical protein
MHVLCPPCDVNPLFVCVPSYIACCQMSAYVIVTAQPTSAASEWLMSLLRFQLPSHASSSPGFCVYSGLTATSKIVLEALLPLCVGVAMVVVYIVGSLALRCRAARVTRSSAHVPGVGAVRSYGSCYVASDGVEGQAAAVRVVALRELSQGSPVSPSTSQLRDPLVGVGADVDVDVVELAHSDDAEDSIASSSVPLVHAAPRADPAVDECVPAAVPVSTRLMSAAVNFALTMYVG